MATQPVTTKSALGNYFHENPTTVRNDVRQGYTRGLQTSSALLHCCGSCDFVYMNVQSFYWPAEHLNTDCHRTVGSAKSIDAASTQTSLQQRAANLSITSAPEARCTLRMKTVLHSMSYITSVWNFLSLY